jgi:hypothetical protein
MRGRRTSEDRRGPSLVVTACALFSVLPSCNHNPHYIGDVCPGAPAGSNACVTFAVGLDSSGVSQLPMELALPGGAIPPTERLRGETAMDMVWTADVGGELRRGSGGPTLGLEAPFTDDTRSVALATGVSSYVAAASTTAAVGSDDFAIELVLRATAGATLFDKRAGAVGWLLREGADGAVVLAVADAAQTAATEVASGPLVEGAWHHCLAWVSRDQGGRVDCNGRPGGLVPLSALGDLDGSSLVTAGGGTASGRVALLALYRVPRGGLGPAASWRDLGAQRFAALTGAGAAGLGSTVPNPDVRDSPAYLDLQRAVGAARRLFLVGTDWPRVACRTDSMNARDCGYLSEPARTRLVPSDPGGFTASELSVQRGQAPFADGEARMAALVPSTANALHALSATSSFDAAHHVFSFFARAGNASRVGASAGGLAVAVYDVASGNVVSAPAGVDASIEAWGDGLFRCAYGFDARPGPTTYVVELADPSATSPLEAPFVGDGATAAVFVAGLQVDVGLRAAGSLIAAELQAADRLTFAASGGNLPARAALSFTMRLIAPAAARATDQPILSLNRASLAEDQVQLFVASQSGHLEYSGRGGGVMRWLIDDQITLADGQRHVLAGSWNAASAEVAINGVVAAAPTLTRDAAPFVFDQIDVAFSPETSDHLEGLLAGLTFSTP